MSNTVTVIFNNVEEFVVELREACKDQPRPEVVRVTHRHTQDVDVNDHPLHPPRFAERVRGSGWLVSESPQARVDQHQPGGAILIGLRYQES